MSSNSSFRAKLKAQPTVGVVLQSASPLVAHSMSAAGFDWLVIDPINSPLSQLESFGMETAVGDGNLTPVLMRVGGPTDRSGIQQATDTGAAGVLVPNVRSASDIIKARRPTQFPPVGDRSLFGPVRAHQKEGMLVHMLRADRSFVVAIQLEKAPTESWDHLLGFDFHVAVLDIPQLCVEIGLYDALLAAPPAGDGTLASPRPTSPAGLLRGAIQYAVTRGGVFASNVSDTAAIVRLDAAREIPDMRILCRWRVLPEHPAWLVDFAAVAIDPASRGQVTLVSADPMRPARIDPGYLTAPADTAVLRRGVDLARAIAATAACRAAGIGAEVLPGAGRTLAHIRQHADTAFHPVGTCRLGGDAGAVVDPWLRVVGISGLRVVDASVMPTTVAGNAQAAVLAIAERAADFIRTGL